MGESIWYCGNRQIESTSKVHKDTHTHSRHASITHHRPTPTRVVDVIREELSSNGVLTRNALHASLPLSRTPDEYNKFKSRTTLLFLMWPVSQLLLMWLLPGFWSSQGNLLLKVHQLWLLYYYLTLSLRENILLANGSDILHWWIYHHYVSMLISTMLLLFPNEYLVSQRLIELLTFGALQGCVMMFQNNYQKKRLYTRKALGKAKAIDVESTETLVEKPTDLKILIPMLFILYFCELWFGMSFLYHYLTDDDGSGNRIVYPLSVFILGCSFIILGIGNAYTTGRVLVSKSKIRQLKQAVKERVTGTTHNNNNTTTTTTTSDKKAQ